MKNRNWYVVISIVLIFTLASLFTGCKEKLTATPAPTEKPEQLDLGGKEIVFAGLEGVYIPVDKESEEYEKAMNWKEEVETLFNCKIKVDVHAPWDVFFQKIQDMTMAGEVIGDIISFDNWIYPKVMLTGLLKPLQDIMNVKDYELWEQEIEQYFSYKGNIYGVSNKTVSLPAAFMIVNKTLFEEKGLDTKYDLKKLVTDRQWTWEKFREILIASTFENQGGNTKIWGLGGQGLQFGRLSNYFVRANGGAYTKKVGDLVEFTANTPEFIEAVEYLSQLVWQDKVISNEDRWRGYESFQTFSSGGSMFFAATNWWISTLKVMVPDGITMSVLPIPIGPKAKGEYVNFSDSARIYGIPSTSTKSIEAAAVFEYWMKNAPKSDKTVRDGWSEMVFDVDSLDVIEMLSKIPRKIEFATSGYTNLQNFWTGEHGIGDQVPIATFIEEWKDPIETEIAQMWSMND